MAEKPLILFPSLVGVSTILLATVTSLEAKIEYSLLPRQTIYFVYEAACCPLFFVTI